jgi:DNA helicase-2/ATP-dependent DNA helicase PcrA
MHGRIDRIDQLPDGTLEIIDYKTGASKEKVSGDEKDQLLIYQMAAEKLPQYAHIGKPSKLTFFYINDNIKVSFLGTTKEIEQLQTKLIELIKQIHEGNFTPTPNPFICNSCDFKDICDYRIL